MVTFGTKFNIWQTQQLGQLYILGQYNNLFGILATGLKLLLIFGAVVAVVAETILILVATVVVAGTHPKHSQSTTVISLTLQLAATVVVAAAVEAAHPVVQQVPVIPVA
jgi:hypothetical protein